MRFICGVSKNDRRRIFSAESAPTIEHIDELTAKLPCVRYDWGREATEEACVYTARVILISVTNPQEAFRLAPEYAADVVRNIGADRMWILPVTAVEDWLNEHRQVM